VAQARALHQPQGVAMGLVWRARLLRAIGRLEDGQRCATEALTIAEHIGAVEEEAGALATLAAILLAMDLPRFALPRIERLRALLDKVDHEGSQAFAISLHARALAAIDDDEGARRALDDLDEHGAPFPHVHVRMALAAGKAWLALGEYDAATQRLQEALEVAQSHGYRYYALVAHHALVGALRDKGERTEHAQAAKRLARVLAQGLTREDAKVFRGRGWGMPLPARV